ncbi:MAG: hypothetical protein AAB691_04355 [Patescibacteria group bacterium]
MNMLRYLFSIFALVAISVTGMYGQQVFDLTKGDDNVDLGENAPVEEPRINPEHDDGGMQDTSTEEQKHLTQLSNESERIARREAGHRSPKDLASPDEIISFDDGDNDSGSLDQKVEKLRKKLDTLSSGASDVRTENGRIHFRVSLPRVSEGESVKANGQGRGKTVRDFVRKNGAALNFVSRDELVPLGQPQNNRNGTKGSFFARYVTRGQYKIRVYDELIIVDADSDTDQPRSITRAHYLPVSIPDDSKIVDAKEVLERLKNHLDGQGVRRDQGTPWGSYPERVGSPELVIGYPGYEDQLVWVVTTPAGEFIQDAASGAVVGGVGRAPEVQ